MRKVEKGQRTIMIMITDEVTEDLFEHAVYGSDCRILEARDQAAAVMEEVDGYRTEVMT